MLVNWLRGRQARDEQSAETPSPPELVARSRQPWVVHPFLIAMFPIASLYSHNIYETPARVLLIPAASSLIGTFLVWRVLRLLTKEVFWAGLATSAMVASFFGYAGLAKYADMLLFQVSQFWVINQIHLPPIVFMGILWFFGFLALHLLFWRSKHLIRVTSYLNAFTLILIALPTIGAISARFREPAEAQLLKSSPTHVKPSGWMPDIYFIVLDGYARPDVMKDLYDLDIQPFLDRMDRRGFFIGRQSTSTYCQTRLSISSTLNADFLSNLIEPGKNDLLPLSKLIRENLVAKLLRERGYTTVSFATGFEPTDNPDADLYLAHGAPLPEFDQLLVEMTPIAPYLAEVKQIDRYSVLREQTLFLFDRLPTIAKMRVPTFTFAHVMSPHPPFIFGENGEDVSPRQFILGSPAPKPLAKSFGTPDYFRDAYRDQASYITKRVEKAIEQILANSPEPPIIVLQSDHGSWLHYHPDDAVATDLRERFGILNCIYMPDRKFDGLYDQMTSVNTFRAILRAVIGADLPQLPDRNFFSPFRSPLEFSEVTDRIHSPEERKKVFLPPPSYYGLLQQF